MKKWLGIGMIAVLFAAAFVAFGLKFGFEEMAIATGAVVFVFGWIFIACRLLDS